MLSRAQLFIARPVSDLFCTLQSMLTNAMGIIFQIADTLFCRAIGNRTLIISDTSFPFLIGANALGILLAANWASDDAELHILCRFGCGSRFYAHSEEGNEEQKGGAPQLRPGGGLAENPGGKCPRTGGTKELQSLRERDTNLPDCDVI